MREPYKDLLEEANEKIAQLMDALQRAVHAIQSDYCLNEEDFCECAVCGGRRILRNARIKSEQLEPERADKTNFAGEFEISGNDER